ncbi:unnamed protein product [Symbiodinium sp. CCMP2456]|nr:unnamed protein product [Symbiodinium sp. CCMP2456]
MAGKGRPLRLETRSISCGTLYAGQSFMESQEVKEEPKPEREDIENDLRAAQAMLENLKMRARKLEASSKEPGPVAGLAAAVDPAPARTRNPLSMQEHRRRNLRKLWNHVQDFNELRELLHSRLVKKEVEEPLTQTESFNQRMEVVIRNVKEGRVVIDSGYYSEAAMKSELKRDKYQRHILEYWIDLRTSGSLSRSHMEEFSQYVEIIDDNASLPAPVLGNEALPCYEGEDDDDSQESCDEDDDDDDTKASETPTSKRKKLRRARTATPRVTKKKRDDHDDELRKKHQAGSGKKLCEHAEQLMKIHDDLAEIRAENGNSTPSAEPPI